MVVQPNNPFPPPAARYRAPGGATALSASTRMAVQPNALLSRAARHWMSGDTAADYVLAFEAAPMHVASV